MCGVAGFLYKDAGRTGPVGETVLHMLDVLGSRGVDGTGVALYGTPQEQALILRVKLGGSGAPEEQARRVEDRLASMGTVQHAAVQDDYLRLVIVSGDDVAALADAVERDDPGVEVFSVGHAME